MSTAHHLAVATGRAHASAATGDLAGARLALEPAIEAAAATMGDHHPEVVAATRLLASLHRRLGELSDARRLLEEILATGSFALGEDHPALLPISYDLAILADELGNRHEARRNFDRLARLGPAVLGHDHEYVRAAERYSSEGPVPRPAPGLPTPRRPAGPRGRSEPWRSPPTQESYQTGPSTDPVSPMTHPAPGSPWDLPPAVAEPHASPKPQRIAWPPDPPTGAGPDGAARSPTEAESDDAAWPRRPEGDDSGGREIAHRPANWRHPRGPLLILALVAVLALIGGAIAAVTAFTVATPSKAPIVTPSGSSIPESSPTGGLLPPGDLRLRDDGASITLIWIDPSNGTVPFVVAGGRAGKAPGPLQSVGSGQTTYTLNGLNPTVDYCFLVAAVYAAGQTVPSTLVCTKRVKRPEPSAS